MEAAAGGGEKSRHRLSCSEYIQCHDYTVLWKCETGTSRRNHSLDLAFNVPTAVLQSGYPGRSVEERYMSIYILIYIYKKGIYIYGKIPFPG